MSSIIFDQITINNFLSIGSAEVPLREQGFTLISGRNEESSIPQSNGSGKSTIFDAIFWTLTGTTLRGATEVVNEKRSSEGCLCSLSFHSETSEYVIERTKSHKTYGNSCRFFIDGVLITDQTKKSEEMIKKTIPTVTSPEVLGSIILLGQGLPYKFSSFSPSKRKDLLETMSGASTEIEKVKYNLNLEEVDCTDKLSSLRSEIMRATGLISGHQNTISILQNQIDSVRTSEEVQTEITRLQDEIVNFQSQIESLESLLEQRNKDYQIYTTSSEEVREFATKCRSSLSMIKSQLASMLLGNCPTCGKPYDVTPEMITQREILETKQFTFESQINSLDIKFNGLRNQIKEITDSIHSTSNSITSLKYKISENQKEITSLCNLKDQTDSLKDQISDIETKITSLKVDINDHTKSVEDLEETLECIGYLKRQLSRDFKGYMLEEVIKFMSSRSEYYSQYLFTTGKKIEITLSGNKILISVGGRLYENLSGGERQRVDLAVQFSLRDMLVTTSGFSCNLIVLDEAFDNLDSQGSDALIKLVVSEFSDIDSVFVITHHSEIDIPYDQQVVVVKGSDGISSLR